MTHLGIGLQVAKNPGKVSHGEDLYYANLVYKATLKVFKHFEKKHPSSNVDSRLEYN